MKTFKLLTLMLFFSSMMFAGEEDPVVMVVAGVPITRSEFEYSYNKNNSDDVIDKKSIDEYVDLFVNYKLKVAAANDAKLDTLDSFKKEFSMYRDQQVRPSFVDDSDLEEEAKSVYQARKERVGTLGLVKPAHIMIRISQDDDDEDLKEAKERIDSIYDAIQNGADFSELAKQLSQDPATARNGGELPWIYPGQTIKDFEDAVYALNVGQMSKPTLTPVGYHIILLKDKKPLEPYDSLRAEIIDFLEVRGARENIVNKKLAQMEEESGGTLTKEDILAARAEELSKEDSDLKNLIREYHDGLLLYEISNQNVWEKASQDTQGLKEYFEKNKKNYYWDSPRYKGMVYHVKNKDDLKAVKNCVKNVDFNDWAEKLRTTFNNDSVLRIRVEKGIFKEGDNAFIDKMVFKKNVQVTPVKDFPLDAVYGKLLKKAPDSFEDVRGLVTADYQDMLEKMWIEELREKYPVEIDYEVLKTVNNH